jgi:GxxExxY protein
MRRTQQEDGMTGRAGRFDECSPAVIGACIEVHRHLGPGLLESAYEACLCQELSALGLHYERQRMLPVQYKGVALEHSYRLDLVVESQLVVEVKAVDRLLPVHEAQLLTYLKLSGLKVGLLVNFHTALLKRGRRRITSKTQKTLPDLPVIPSSHTS